VKKLIIYILIVLVSFSLTLGVEIRFNSPKVLAKKKQKNVKLKVRKELDFGRVYAGSTGLQVNPSDPGALTVDVRGAGNTEYEVSFSTQEITLTPKKGSGSITVSNFTSSLTDNIGTLNSKGRDTFYVGATIEEIPLDVSAGEYSGEGLLTVDYRY
jgi:hypothetical protein